MDGPLDLVRVEKKTLRFPATAPDTDTPLSDTLHVTNVAQCDLGFKVKTTNQARYIVRPNVGVIAQGTSLSIHIGLQTSPDDESDPEPGLSKDKFLLLVAEAPETAQLGLPPDYWVEREDDTDVVGMKFKVEFFDDQQQDDLVDELDAAVPDITSPATTSGSAAQTPRQRDLPPAMQASSSTPPPGSIVAAPVVRDPLSHSTQDSSLKDASAVRSSASGRRSSAMSDLPVAGLVNLADLDELLEDANYDHALQRVRELQAMLDAKNLELARLRTELAETRAESERVLKEAPKTPLSANKVLSDPFGGVSVAGFGLMLLLFLILVNVILRIV